MTTANSPGASRSRASAPAAGDQVIEETDPISEVLLAAFDAFLQEHRRCRDLKSGVEDR